MPDIDTKVEDGCSEVNEEDVELLERLSLLESKMSSLEHEILARDEEEETEKNNESIDTFQSSVAFRAGEGQDEVFKYVDNEKDPRVNMNARQPRSFRTADSFMTRRINADDDYKGLSEDTFTMMIMSKPGSKQWWYAFFIFLFQITLLTMILQDQWTYEFATTPFNVPYRNTRVVHSGQLLAILLSLATQTDLVIAIITFIMLWSRRRVSWTGVAGVADDSKSSVWTLRIALPLTCKFIEGVLVLITTFVIVIQSDSMIELFKDFAAMQLISELDNMMFWMALHGYAGIELMEGAKKAQKVRIKDDVVKSYCGIPLRTMVLVGLFFVMFSGWVYIVMGQANGSFFRMKFPHCHISEARIPLMGDGMCDGGAQNTISCNFDDGDCLSFNIAYPGCRVVETYLIGNGECNPDFNSIECGFDGLDCCPVLGDERLGDGICDGLIFNTDICGYDEGDCDDFNTEYPLCSVSEDFTINELYNEYKKIDHKYFGLGDGFCDNLGLYVHDECGLEGGDCMECFAAFEAAFEKDDDFFDTLADGHCDGSSPLNIEICGFDGFDCYECMEMNLNNTEFIASRLGDGQCDGGVYMTDACFADAGDCDEFLDNYPDCKAEQPWRVGDGNCDSEYDNEECREDGGDCQQIREQFNLLDCHVDDINRIQDGICDGGEYRTESCLFDGGDCDGCQGNIHFIGDGICDGGIYISEECGYDGGDCDQCNTRDISRVGDGICDEFLNNPDCYYDGGDCLGFDGFTPVPFGGV